ncbi:hypothetical protein [Aquimarina algiphila]|uniref:hypothetical protein n=1 Tax=Aquimarina algiphila TaxID=2047982 RepID=UPI0023301736|nr:hypothetical protein [Aquimarina algiphila]
MAERNYGIKDTVLLEWGDIIVEHLKTDIEEFITFDAKLNRDFITDLEQKVAQGYKDGGDVVNIAQLQEKTEVVEKAMQDCRTYFKRLKYWVLDAFPNQKAIQRQFGIGRFREVSRNQVKMIQFIEGLEETISQHSIALETAGASVDLLTQPSTLSQALRIANKEQEQKKGTRTVDTAARVEQLNELYAILQKVNAAADNVFEEQPTKRELYRSPGRNGTPVIIDEEE